MGDRGDESGLPGKGRGSKRMCEYCYVAINRRNPRLPQGHRRIKVPIQSRGHRVPRPEARPDLGMKYRNQREQCLATKAGQRALLPSRTVPANPPGRLSCLVPLLLHNARHAQKHQPQRSTSLHEAVASCCSSTCVRALLVLDSGSVQSLPRSSSFAVWGLV